MTDNEIYREAIKDTTTNCYDYIQNQGENEVDVGGPCDSCYNDDHMIMSLRCII